MLSFSFVLRRCVRACVHVCSQYAMAVYILDNAFMESQRQTKMKVQGDSDPSRLRDRCTLTGDLSCFHGCTAAL